MDGVQLSQGWSHLAVKNSMAPWEALRLRIKIIKIKRRIKINLYRPNHTLTRMKQKQKAIKTIKQMQLPTIWARKQLLKALFTCSSYLS